MSTRAERMGEMIVGWGLDKDATMTITQFQEIMKILLPGLYVEQWGEEDWTTTDALLFLASFMDRTLADLSSYHHRIAAIQRAASGQTTRIHVS